jgi:hypothetical protein
MVQIKPKFVLVSLLATVLAMTAIALPSTAGAANPGEVCNLNRTEYVTRTPSESSEILYMLFSGAGFRIVEYAGPNYYYGHGNGKANGYIERSSINQSSCHNE